MNDKNFHERVLPKMFHCNGHTMGSCPQIQKLERDLSSVNGSGA